MIDPWDIYNFIRDEYVGTEKTYARIKEVGSSDWLDGYHGGKQMVLHKMMLRFLDTNDLNQILKEAEYGK